MSAGPCWAIREEVDPRYDVQSDAFAPETALWAPDCGHQACIDDPCPGFHDWDCPVVKCRYATMHAMCDLDQKHEGEHVFTNPNEIVLIFPPPTTHEPASTAGGAGGS